VQGRPAKKWRKTFKGGLRNISVKWDEAETVSADRRQCRTLIAQCAQLHRRNEDWTDIRMQLQLQNKTGK
jgi:hypothetical protein